METYHALWLLQTSFWEFPPPHHSASSCFSSVPGSCLSVSSCAHDWARARAVYLLRSSLLVFNPPADTHSTQNIVQPTGCHSTLDNRQRGAVGWISFFCGQSLSSQRGSYFRNALLLAWISYCSCWLAKVTLISNTVIDHENITWLHVIACTQYTSHVFQSERMLIYLIFCVVSTLFKARQKKETITSDHKTEVSYSSCYASNSTRRANFNNEEKQAPQ